MTNMNKKNVLKKVRKALYKVKRTSVNLALPFYIPWIKLNNHFNC